MVLQDPPSATSCDGDKNDSTDPVVRKAMRKNDIGLFKGTMAIIRHTADFVTSTYVPSAKTNNLPGGCPISLKQLNYQS